MSVQKFYSKSRRGGMALCGVPPRSYIEQRVRQIIDAGSWHSDSHQLRSGHPYHLFGTPAVTVRGGKFYIYKGVLEMLGGPLHLAQLSLRLQRLGVERNGLKDLAAILAGVRPGGAR